MSNYIFTFADGTSLNENEWPSMFSAITDVAIKKKNEIYDWSLFFREMTESDNLADSCYISIYNDYSSNVIVKCEDMIFGPTFTHSDDGVKTAVANESIINNNITNGISIMNNATENIKNLCHVMESMKDHLERSIYSIKQYKKWEEWVMLNDKCAVFPPKDEDLEKLFNEYYFEFLKSETISDT